MGFMDAVRGLYQSDAVQGVLESTGLADHVGSHLGEGTAIVESVGVDPAQVTEMVSGGEVLPSGVGAAVEGIEQLGGPEPPVP